MPKNPDMPDRTPAPDLESSAIEALAHALWEERGCPLGSPEEDWFRAERELSDRQEEAVPASAAKLR